MQSARQLVFQLEKRSLGERSFQLAACSWGLSCGAFVLHCCSEARDTEYKSGREENFFALQLEAKHKRNILESLQLCVDGEVVMSNNLLDEIFVRNVHAEVLKRSS